MILSDYPNNHFFYYFFNFLYFCSKIIFFDKKIVILIIETLDISNRTLKKKGDCNNGNNTNYCR